MNNEDLKRRIKDAELICEDIDDSEAIVCVVGTEYKTLEDQCCDMCRYKLLVQVGIAYADHTLARYKKAKKNARH